MTNLSPETVDKSGENTQASAGSPMPKPLCGSVANHEPAPLRMTEYELHTLGARHSYEPPYDGKDPDRNKPTAASCPSTTEVVANIDRLRNLIRAATPGPLVLATSNSWRRIEARNGGAVCSPTTQPDGHPDLHFPNGGAEGPDATLLIEAYNALPALLDHIAAQATEIDEAKGQIEHLDKQDNLLREALRIIEQWNIPLVQSRNGDAASMSAEYGSNGVRDYFRAVARTALLEIGHDR